jgi:hydrogenase maturation protease
MRIGEHVQSLPEIVVIGIEIGTVVYDATLEITPEVLKGVNEAVRLIKEEISSTL